MIELNPAGIVLAILYVPAMVWMYNSGRHKGHDEAVDYLKSNGFIKPEMLEDD